MRISYLEALFGFNRTFKHLDGSEFNIKIDHKSLKPIATDDVRAIPGKGFPIERSSEFGTLYIMFEVVYPDKPVASSLTEEQITEIKNMLAKPSVYKKSNNLDTKHASSKVKSNVEETKTSMTDCGVVASMRHKQAFETK